jgi:hypothetical protein
MRLLVLMLMVLAGCVKIDSEDTIKKRGDARVMLFRECMELAAKMPRQADDDVSDVVNECTQSSYYMTNYLK